MEGILPSNHQLTKQRLSPQKSSGNAPHLTGKQNQVGTVILYGIPIVSLVIESQERLCLAQISNTLLKQYSYNEIHNRRVALGITCVQCTPVQLEILRRAGAMPVSSRRCGMITRREAERLCKSFLGDNAPPRLPDDFAFSVHHECAWGCRGAFLPSRYNSSRAKCIKCTFCGLFFSPNKFIFHSHRTSPNATYVQPDAANFNSWRRHMKLSGSPPDDVTHAWEDVKAMFNGGTRKRLLASTTSSNSLSTRSTITTSVPIPITPTPSKQIKLDSSTPAPNPYSISTPTPLPVPAPPRVPPFPDLPLPISMMDYVWHNGVNVDGIKHQFPFPPYAIPWFGNTKRSVLGLSSLSPVSAQQDAILQHLRPQTKLYHQSAFRPVFPALGRPDILMSDVQSNLMKRSVDTDDSLDSPCIFNRPKEKVEEEIPVNNNCIEQDIDIVRNDSRSDNENIRNDTIDKGNELQKQSENEIENGDTRDSYTEIIRSDYSQNGVLKMTFKKEMVNEGSNDSDETGRGLTKNEVKEPKKDVLEPPRLLSVKTKIREENPFKFREFSPNFLEAISNLKTEERGMYSRMLMRRYHQDADKIKELKDIDVRSEKRCNGNSENHSKSKPVLSVEDEEESRNCSRSEEDEDDETVDIETTDDCPVQDSAQEKIQDTSKQSQQDKHSLRIEETGDKIGPCTETNKTNRIWTIARFSLEESDRSSYVNPQQPGFCFANDNGNSLKNRKEVEDMNMNGSENRKQKTPSVDCLSCCQVAFGNG